MIQGVEIEHEPVVVRVGGAHPVVDLDVLDLRRGIEEDVHQQLATRVLRQQLLDAQVIRARDVDNREADEFGCKEGGIRLRTVY